MVVALAVALAVVLVAAVALAGVLFFFPFCLDQSNAAMLAYGFPCNACLKKKDEALSSIEIFLPELRGHFSPCPKRDHRSVFLVCIFVVVVSTDDNQHLVT